MKIEKYNYTGKVYNIEVEPNHEINDDQFFINADNGIVVHNCHPRDNIALRWLAKEYDIGYDLFDTIMLARERQAENLATFLIRQSINNGYVPIYIHGKAYKPDVPYCIGSYSTLIGHYIKRRGHTVYYIDPRADDREDCVANIDKPAVVLLAHNRHVTYGYTGRQLNESTYCEIPRGSVIVDPWRKTPDIPGITVIHYGNSRKSNQT